MTRMILGGAEAERIVERGTVCGIAESELLRKPVHRPVREEECRCWITNDGAAEIRAGDMAAIHAMTDADLDSEEAAQNWVEYGIRGEAKLIGNIDDANSGRLARVTALEDIYPGGTGRAEPLGAFMAWIWRDPEEFGETERFTPRADWRTAVIDGIPLRRLACVRYPGDYAVIDAARITKENRLFALLIPSFPGHAASTVTAVDVEEKRVTLACGVDAALPLHRAAVNLIGKKAVISRGMVNRRWEVIALEDGEN